MYRTSVVMTSTLESGVTFSLCSVLLLLVFTVISVDVQFLPLWRLLCLPQFVVVHIQCTTTSSQNDFVSHPFKFICI